MEESILEDKAISVRKFVSARTQELVALSSRVPQGNGNGGTSVNIPYKHIPKNLRRRAVSHNVKRIPSRFRPSIKKGGPNKDNLPDPLSFVSSKKKKKQFSRKHRRRNSNLLSLYNRRQRIHKWMETHIWHAKRFHMDLKWNCKVPISSCEKGQRAIYRSAKRYATMQDISFMSCFEMTGNFDDLCTGFALITPRQCNTLSIGALMYKNGEREGTLHIYHKKSYPLGYIGQIQFTWLKTKVPTTTVEDGKSSSPSLSSLWLWLHPAFKDEFIQEITSLFSLHPSSSSTSETIVEMESEQVDPTTITPEKSLSIDEIKLLGKQLNCNPCWINSDKSISLKDLHGELNRIRFYGPDVFNVLKETLHVHAPEKSEKEMIVVDTKRRNFWLPSKAHDDDNNTKFLLAQNLLWDVLETSTNVPSHAVLPLIVRDPRIFLPQSRTKVLCDFYGDNDDDDGDEGLPMEEEEGESGMSVDDDDSGGCGGEKSDSSVDVDIFKMFNKFISIAQSPLENSETRLNIIKEKMTDEEYCKRRAELLIPGSQIELGEDENQVPIILIQRPASSNSKSFNDGGFDLILPAGWVMAFWISFVYRAVRVAGLRDSTAFAFESSNLHSLQYLAPDSKAGTQEETESETRVRSEFFKLPPAKRSNLIKLGCCSPFTCDWNSLLLFWQSKSQEESQDNNQVLQSTCSEPVQSSSLLLPAPTVSTFYVLRDSALLKILAQNVKCKKWSQLCDNLCTINQNPDYCLIGIRIESLNRGKATKGAVICLPTPSDFDNLCSFNSNIMHSKSTDNEQPPPPSSSTGTINNNQYTWTKRNVSDPPIHTEPTRDDKEASRKRTEFRQKHQKFMAYLRKKRKKLREKAKQNVFDTSKLEEEAKLLDVAQDSSMAKIAHYDSSKVSELYNEEMNKMWLIPPEKILQSFKENSRIPMGHVVYGGDEYSKGKCSALGFVTLTSLLKFAKMASATPSDPSSPSSSTPKKFANIILWRNWQDSFVYRASKFQICRL